MIAADTLKLLAWGHLPAAEPGRDLYTIYLGELDGDTVLDVGFTVDGQPRTIKLPPRPPGSTYVSIDPRTGAITTVVDGSVIFRGEPDPGLVRLFEAGRAWGKTRTARKQIGRRR